MSNPVALIVWLAASFSAGWFGSQFKPGAWYDGLKKPIWTPPSIAFPIAWTILYTLMGIAAWMVWRHKTQNSWAFTALLCFVCQLVLNALWSWIFFGLHQMGWALVEMILLWGMIAATLVTFWRVNAVAGGLMVPYLLWVSFAVALNAAMWVRN